MFWQFYSYGVIHHVIAIIHFIQRRPDTYWLFIILMGGGLGSLVYIAVQASTELRLIQGASQVFLRRKRNKTMQAMELDNPSVGNFEELGGLLLDDGQF